VHGAFSGRGPARSYDTEICTALRRGFFYLSRLRERTRKLVLSEAAAELEHFDLFLNRSGDSAGLG